MRVLLVDDLREFVPSADGSATLYLGERIFKAAPEDEIFIARNLHDAHLLMQLNKAFDYLLLDNDLGTEEEGRYLLNYLEGRKFNGDISQLPWNIIPITSNPAARVAMNATIRKLQEGTPHE